MDVAIIRQGELVGRGLMAYETTEEVGVVEHLLVNVQKAEVVGLAYKTLGLIGRQQRLDWRQLVKIGKDRIVVQAEIAEAVESRLSAAQDMTDLEVWTDGGDLIGRVVDICFDQSSGQVEQYLFALRVEEEAEAPDQTAVLYGEDGGDSLEGAEAAAENLISVYAIAPRMIISAGRKRMMIAEEDARRSQPYHQQLTLPPQTVAQPVQSSWKPEQLPIPTDFGELLQKGQSIAGQVSERVREQAKRVVEGSSAATGREGEATTPLSYRGEGNAHEQVGLPDITEQLQEKTEQVKRQFQKAKEKAQEQVGNRGLEKRLGKTAFGRALGNTFSKLNSQTSSQRFDTETDSIDVESFEVWEEEESDKDSL